MGAALMSLVGVFVSAYLYLYKIGRIGTLACGTGGCETVQASQWSRFLGVEVALIGLVGYGLLFAVSLLALRTAAARQPWPARLTALAAGGVLFTLYLTYLELFVIHAVCRWCVGSAVIILSILILAILALRQAPEPQAD
ncbi:MAG: vitamin K epoxide reductase family protein [Gemmatimonadales bacterium]